MKRTTLLFAALLAVLAPSLSAQIAHKAQRSFVGGFDLIAYKTEVKDVVTFRGSIPAGDVFAPENNIAIPTLAGEMLDQGTEKQDKFAITQKLDDIGASINFSVGGVMVEFYGKCLRKDLPTVIDASRGGDPHARLCAGGIREVKETTGGRSAAGHGKHELPCEPGAGGEALPKRSPELRAANEGADGGD